MSFLGKIFNKGPKPIIAKSHEGNLDSLRANRAGPQSPGAVKKPDVFYVTASVELGNTTTKCIVMATNLNTSELKTYKISVTDSKPLLSLDVSNTILESTFITNHKMNR